MCVTHVLIHLQPMQVYRYHILFIYTQGHLAKALELMCVRLVAVRATSCGWEHLAKVPIKVCACEALQLAPALCLSTIPNLMK